MDLTATEKKLVMLWRSIGSRTLEITYENYAPVRAKAWWEEGRCLETRIPSAEDITPSEYEVLDYGRRMGWGVIIIEINEGQPIRVLRESFRNFRLQ